MVFMLIISLLVDSFDYEHFADECTPGCVFKISVDCQLLDVNIQNGIKRKKEKTPKENFFKRPVAMKKTFNDRCLEKKKKKRGVKEEINDLAEKDSPTLLTSDINSVDLQHPPTQTQSSGKIQRKKKAPPNLAFVLIFVLKKEQLFSVSAFIKASYWIHDLNESTQMFGKIFFAAFPTVHYCTYKIQDV